MQKKLLSQLTAILQEYEDVVALGVTGSVASDELDGWSDLDLIVVVTELERVFPHIEWLRPLGKIFTYSQSGSEARGTTRIVFDDLRRLDLSFYTREIVLQLQPADHVSFWQGAKIVFSQSDEISAKLIATYAPPANQFSREDFAEMANNFWFKSVVAVTKIVRDDRLIAAHLTLDCWRDVMVLAMVERDFSTGTTVHKSSGMGNVFIDQLPAIHDFSAASLLSQLEKAAVQFETIAARLYPDYVSKRQPLVTLINRAS